jgi:hypothetical protein
MLERELRELGREVEWPAGPPADFSDRVVAALPSTPALREGTRRRRRRLIVIMATVLALLGGGLAAVEPARTAILDWLGLRGATVQRVPVTPAAPRVERPVTGERVSLAEAREGVDFAVETPPALGRPDAVHLDRSLPGGAVTLTYGDPPRLLLTAFAGRPGLDLVQKMAGPGTGVRRVSVRGEPGLWLSGGPHSVVFVGRDGIARSETRRLAGNTLLWQRGERTLRLEGAISLPTALRIARSVG